LFEHVTAIGLSRFRYPTLSIKVSFRSVEDISLSPLAALQSFSWL
jgi:hypothetical protein